MREFGSPLLILDCERVRAQYRKLRTALAGCRPALCAEASAARGGGADGARGGRLPRSRDHRRGAAGAALGVAPAALHSHAPDQARRRTSATLSHFGVRTFVADNPDEVRKFARFTRARRAAAARVLPQPGRGVRSVAQVRLRPGGRARARAAGGGAGHRRARPVVSCRLAGARIGQARRGHRGLRAADRRGAAREARALDTLDIGGGFPIDYVQPAQDIGRFCAPIRAALAQAAASRMRVIAEPGRYIVGPAAIGVASVMGRARREGHWWYYLDDGLYGSYSGQLYDHARYPVEPLRARAERLPSVLAGPPATASMSSPRICCCRSCKAGDLIVGRAMGPTPGRAPRNSTSFRRRRSFQ